METSKMETTDIRQIERLLQTQLENIAEPDRIRLVSMVDDYFSLLEKTQRLPGLHRLKFFDCAYIVFSFLHLKGELKRHRERFDDVCINDLRKMFKRLYDKL